jgi:ADP-ribosylglycohydrolase
MENKSKESLNKCQNMLLGVAIGDALGAGYEMRTQAEIKKDFILEKYVRRGDSKINPGEYTDDTQMTIAVVELLLSKEKFTKEELAQKFVEVYHRDIRDGYSNSTQTALLSSKNGKELLVNIKSDSIKNGACMRAVPLGILPDLKKVIEYGKINAETTHNTPKGITSSVCIAAASHYFYYELGKPEEVFDFCIKACKGLDKESLDFFIEIKNMNNLEPKLLFGEGNELLGVPCDGMRTAGAVMYILSKYSKSTKETLKESILLGGDVDSVASIALGIAAINRGIKELPANLFNDLENKKYGKDYLLKLGKELFKANKTLKGGSHSKR